MMARGAGLPRGAVFSLCLPTTDGFFLGSHRCCQQILARLFKLQRCQIVALENHSGGSKERIKLRIQEHGARASLGASPAPEDRRECLLCVHKTLGLWVSGHVTHHAFCTVTWHAAIPFRDGISSSDLPPKGLLFQGGEARVLRFRVYTAHFPITVTFDRSSVSRRP